MNRTKNLFVGVILAAAVGLSVWQQMRITRLVEENRRLSEDSAAVPALRKEIEGLRPVKVDQAELARLRGAQTEVQQLRSRLSAAQIEATQSKSRPNGSLGAKSSEGNGQTGDGTNGFGGAFGGLMKDVAEQQFLGQLGRMKAKLNLSPDQEDGIRKILLKQADQATQMAQKMFAGGKVTKEDLANAQGAAGKPEEEIKALLSPDQRAAYADYKQEETRSNSRLAANAEMMQLQNTLGLSQEQQDQVYGILYEQNAKLMNPELANPTKSMDPATVLQQQFEQKFKALEGVLTPDQAESYRQFQENQLKMVKKMMPQFRQPEPGTPAAPIEVSPK